MEAVPRRGDAVLPCRTFEQRVSTLLPDTGGRGGYNAGTRRGSTILCTWHAAWRAHDVVMLGD